MYCIAGAKYEPAPYVVPAVRSLSPQGKEAKEGSPTKGKRDKSKDKAQTPDPAAQVINSLNALD
jgi:hypothetical protein